MANQLHPQPSPGSATPPTDEDHSRSRRIVVAVGGAMLSERLIHEGKRLADALGCSWEAVHIETPETGLEEDKAVAGLLGIAGGLGASVATLPAGDVAGGLEAHLESMPGAWLVVGRAGWRGHLGLRRRSLIDRIGDWPHAPTLVVVSADDVPASTRPAISLPADVAAHAGPRAHGLTLLLVALTAIVAVSLHRLAGARVLDLLFLFPVITAAAQFGLRPALTAAVTSVLAYNFFLIAPYHSFSFKTPQSLVMAVVLAIVAVYTSILTARLRSRVRLSDRSAAENARVAAFGQSLAVAADWEGTGQIVCDEIAALLQVQAAVLREKEGKLEPSGFNPTVPRFGPLDQAALDWCWTNGVIAGSGTEILPAADWQFQPLKTSLGMLAVIAIARLDGRDPVRADQAVLLSTLVAQAALAHERLRLEDQIGSVAA